MMEKIFSIILICTLLINFKYITKKTGTTNNPSSLYLLIWFLFLFFSLITQFSHPINFLAILYIVVCSNLFCLSIYFFEFNSNKSKIKSNTINIFASKNVLSFFYILFSVSLLFNFVNLYYQGFDLINVIMDLQSVTSEYTARRYASDIKPNFYSQYGLIITYITAIVGGGIVHHRKFKHINLRGIHILSLSPSLIVMLTQGAKGAFFLAIFYFLGGFLLSKSLYNDKNSIKQYFNLYLLFIFSFILLAFLFFTFLARGNDSDSLLLFWYYFSSYSFASLYAFSDWFSFYINHKSVVSYHFGDFSYGFETFTSLFKTFGSQREILPGYYDDYYESHNISTNIYTIYRGLISDFSILGSMVAVFLTGFICNTLFFLSRSIKFFRTFYYSLFVMMPAIFYNSTQISLFIWNGTFFLMFALIPIFFLFNKKIKFN